MNDRLLSIMIIMIKDRLKDITPFNGRTGSIKIIFCSITFYFVTNVMVMPFLIEKKKYQNYLIGYDTLLDRSLSNNKNDNFCMFKREEKSLKDTR